MEWRTLPLRFWAGLSRGISGGTELTWRVWRKNWREEIPKYRKVTPSKNLDNTLSYPYVVLFALLSLVVVYLYMTLSVGFCRRSVV